jgi:uncharacterized membrane protein
VSGNGRICYLGDDHPDAAAAYLCGIMNHYGLAFDHVPSGEAPGADFTRQTYSLYVVSDYPAACFPQACMEHVVACVRAGSGLAMLGGWESYHGRLGEYPQTPLAQVLPVQMRGEDDRHNCSQLCLVNRVADHEIVDGLPFDTPPGIGGFNLFEPRGGGDWVHCGPDDQKAFKPCAAAQVVLKAQEYAIERQPDGEVAFCAREEFPLLVVGEYGLGRTVALATDVAPHWVGGFVDWGDARVTAQVEEEGFIEVGNWYARFFRNLLVWAGRLNSGESEVKGESQE